MKLSTTQQIWAETFELSDSLVEDAAAGRVGQGSPHGVEAFVHGCNPGPP